MLFRRVPCYLADLRDTSIVRRRTLHCCTGRRLMTDPKVARLKTPEECETFIQNVKATHPELVAEARRRAVELKAAAYGAKSAAERDAIQAVYAAEAALTHKNGKKTRASRTWQSIERWGILIAVERVVTRRRETDGYQILSELGMLDHSFEAVVLRHPEAFSAEAVQSSRDRLADSDA